MTRFVQGLRIERSRIMKTLKLLSVFGAMASLSLFAGAYSSSASPSGSGPGTMPLRITNVEDCGNPLPSGNTFAATAVAAQLPVNLRTSSNFVILTKSGISTTGATSIVGDIGVSPIDSTAITGFGLTISPANTFATSSLVTGRVYAPDYAAPTPAYLTSAVHDMETAYNDAAGRPFPDFTELGAGNISGLTLVPGLYKWGTGVQIDNNGVTLSGSATDVWIFQISDDLTVSSGAIVTLSGGARARNIFWQVAGRTTLGTTSEFKGIILCKTLIAMKTGATLFGRALAQTAVTLQANTVRECSHRPYAHP